MINSDTSIVNDKTIATPVISGNGITLKLNCARSFELTRDIWLPAESVTCALNPRFVEFEVKGVDVMPGDICSENSQILCGALDELVLVRLLAALACVRVMAAWWGLHWHTTPRVAVCL